MTDFIENIFSSIFGNNVVLATILIAIIPIIELIDDVLPKKKADIVKMHWIERYQTKEIAQMVGCTQPNISGIISTARKKILKYCY